MFASMFAFVALMALRRTLAAPVTSSISGALFFMTNDPSGNEVVINALGSDGKASFVKTVATGGKGATGHGGGPDALFSQDALHVAYGNLFVVNPGSNTLSAFALDSKEPTNIRQLGKAVSTSGEFPVSVARSPGKHHQVCVLNGGALNGVACFYMNHAAGLTPMKNSVRQLFLNQTTPATGPAGSVSDLFFSEDGKQLLATVKGAPPTKGFVAVWDVADDASLSQDFTHLAATAGGLPFGSSIIPGKDAFLATDPAVGATTFSLSLGSSILNSSSVTSPNTTSMGNSTSTSVTKAIPISGQGATCWSARSNKTGSFFVTDIVTSTVTEISVDDNLQGRVVKQYPQTPKSGTIDDAIGTIHGNDFLYILAPNATSPQIDVLSVGNAPGQAKSLQTLDIGAALTKNKTKFAKVNMQGMAVFVPTAHQ